MDEGGESACWLERVCPECGRLRERPGPAPCEHCGAAEDDAPRPDDTPHTDGAPCRDDAPPPRST
ncbi:hypothetical protein ACIRST_00665 [Kitasatospora sp. NPDC101447]|uniref:hypothetical protein n=1 Tax=Kitasatospora sp. NPDC101447 TaxID=3364102 RepID=UPI0038037198